MERASSEEWAKRVERWRDSGLSATEVGLNAHSLRWWSWRLGGAQKSSSPKPRTRRARSTTPSAPTLAPMTFVEMTRKAPREPFEVVLASGAKIRVASDFDAAALARLLDVLGR